MFRRGSSLLFFATLVWLAMAFLGSSVWSQDPAPAPVPAAPPTTATVPATAVAPTTETVNEIALIEHQDDISFHMVAIEALVVEINEERTRELGLQYGFNKLTIDELTGLPIDGAPDNVLDGGDVRLGRALTPVRVPVLIRGLEGATNVGFDSSRMPGLGMSLVGMNIGSQVVSARLRALLEQGDASVRTRPIAVALHNSQTTIKATDEIPYQDIDKTANPFVAYGSNLVVSFEPVGVTMEVIPQIVSLRPGVATLDITKLEVSSVSNYITTANVDRPVFNRSSTKTKVTLAEGETFVIGGLKTRRTVHSEDRVPILGSIWLVGYLFRSQSTIERNMDVLFFITPSILSPGENFLLPFDFKNQRALGLDVNTHVAGK